MFIRNILQCTSCVSGLTLIDSICLHNPTPYSSENLGSPVINIKFDTISIDYRDIFQNGNVKSTYAPFNNPDSDGPWPLVGKGLCFSTNKFITSKVNFQLNYEHTVAVWVRCESSSAFFDSPGLSIAGAFIVILRLKSNLYSLYYKSRRSYSNNLGSWIFFFGTP